MLCLIKNVLNTHFLLIYLLSAYLLYLFNESLYCLPNLVLIIIVILMCLINCIWIASVSTDIVVCNCKQNRFIVMFETDKKPFES